MIFCGAKVTYVERHIFDVTINIDGAQRCMAFFKKYKFDDTKISKM